MNPLRKNIRQEKYTSCVFQNENKYIWEMNHLWRIAWTEIMSLTVWSNYWSGFEATTVTSLEVRGRIFTGYITGIREGLQQDFFLTSNFLSLFWG